MRTRSLSPVLLFLLLLSLAMAPVLTGCGGGESEANAEDGTSTPEEGEESTSAEEEEEEEERVPVEVAALQRGPMENVIRSTASLEAESEVAVYSEAARRVQQLLVEEGDVVKKGQVLLRLQDAEQRSALARAQTDLKKAETELERQRRLHERQLTTEQALNDATFDFEQKTLAVKDAERELGYATVRAPINGTITMRHVNVGDQLQVNAHLFDIVDFDSLVARIYIPEKNLSEVAVGQTARVVAGALSPQPYAGEVLRVSPIVDPRSGTVKVTVAVGGQRGLRPGLYVDVGVVTASRDDALLIPKRALLYDNDQIFVYRLQEDHTVTRTAVVPKLTNKDYLEPLQGFAPGDSVVVAGQAGLKDGAKVDVVANALAENIQ